MPVGTTPPEDMTLAQLRAEFLSLAEELSVIGARRKALRTEYSRRVDINRMQAQIDALTEGQREAARQILCT